MLKPGDLLRKRYKIAGILGGGSFGTVYAIDDLQWQGKRWALKEIVEGELPEEGRREALELFRREVEILRMLDHQGLPRIADAFSEGECHYLVMDFIEGKTLEELLKIQQGPFSPEEVISWAFGLARILEYLHSRAPQPVIFRDLKPSNIIRSRENAIYLIDFGIARLFNPQKLKDTVFMGTPGFAAPEQYGRGQSDARSDIFSFGATLYHLLTNQDMMQFNFKFPPVRNFSPDTPEWFEKVLSRCLALNPGERYQNMKDLAADIVMEQPSKGGAGAQGAPGLFSSTTAKKSGLPGTCIEWLIVAVIIVIFIMIFQPRSHHDRFLGQLTACKSNLKNYGTALEMYASDWQGKYPESLSVITPNYLRTFPTCPSAAAMSYAYLHRREPEVFTIFCRGKSHIKRRVSEKEDYPRYDSIKGLIEP
jgi:serine/threonine protein kinase